jgi:hypothetical protein
MKIPWLWIGGGSAALAVWVISKVSRGESFVPNVVTELTRTPQDILDAVAAINPENNPDLQPGAANEYGTVGTWCNRFIALVTEALGAPIPYGTAGMRANDQIDWLGQGNGGWYPTSKAGAQAAALAGHLAVATYRNLNGSGHLALVLPIPGAMQIAQAGAHNYNMASLASGFGSIQPIFFAHD